MSLWVLGQACATPTQDDIEYTPTTGGVPMATGGFATGGLPMKSIGGSPATGGVPPTTGGTPATGGSGGGGSSSIAGGGSGGAKAGAAGTGGAKSGGTAGMPGGGGAGKAATGGMDGSGGKGGSGSGGGGAGTAGKAGGGSGGGGTGGSGGAKSTTGGTGMIGDCTPSPDCSCQELCPESGCAMRCQAVVTCAQMNAEDCGTEEDPICVERLPPNSALNLCTQVWEGAGGPSNPQDIAAKTAYEYLLCICE